MAEFLFKEESDAILEAAKYVYSTLGCGFLEHIYQESLAIEFNRRKIPFEKEKRLPVKYDGIMLSKYYIADFVCYEKIIVEIKAICDLKGVHLAQTINYLKATDMPLGYLINFGSTYLQYRRVFPPYKR